jgi:hypothetical protein
VRTAVPLSSAPRIRQIFEPAADLWCIGQMA